MTACTAFAVSDIWCSNERSVGCCDVQAAAAAASVLKRLIDVRPAINEPLNDASTLAVHLTRQHVTVSRPLFISPSFNS